MKAARNILHFLLVAAIGTVACVVLLLQRSQWPCDRAVPAPHVQVATLGNGTQQEAADPSMKKLVGNGKKKAGSSDDDKLSEVLRRAAMEDNTIIMTFTNEAWTAPGSLLDLFLESFRIGVRTEPLLRHLLIVAIDGKAFERCRRVHPLCYALPVGGDGVSFEAEQSYMAGDYVDMLWRRNRFQARVLALGYGFVFTDVDIVWFRNPLLRIPVAADFAMSCDAFYGDNPYDLDKRANGGFVYARPSARTLALYGAWYEARKRFRGQHEQFVFDRVKHELVARSGVAAQFVDTDYLGGFCERGKRRDFHKLCTFHANCLVGLKTKLQKLRGVLDEWKRFKEKAGKPGTNITALTD
ncbi:uncharacterized protein C2845_PM03G02420 [Panicum miliaceum]|uniref:Nucleotide-diphospho-sugar transferase domain-containing protein n=1 Tax=Panicum miliaceum TaxID=4540 RepID=A0A3L6T4L5_PANMI|nr:uncharacterized protein C2845_PM03G02420 [Panicum miliaceum]